MDEKSLCGIYKITSPTGRVYVGQSVDIRTRFSKYRGMHCHGQRRLYASFVKHGVESHIFDVLETSEEENLSNIERKWQDYYEVLGPKGMNCKLTGDSCRSGRHSEETVKKISIANTGRKHTPEAKEKMRAAKLGKRMPEDQRLAMIGRKANISPEAAERRRNRMVGNQYTKGMRPVNAKKVMCEETGSIFPNVAAAAESIGVKSSTLGAYLRGQIKNKTSMRYM